MDSIAFAPSRTPATIMENGRKRAPEYRQFEAQPAEIDEDGKETRAAQPAYEEPGDRGEWLDAVRCSQPQQLADTMRGMYNEGTMIDKEIHRLRNELASTQRAVKSFEDATGVISQQECKADSTRRRYQVAFWSMLIGSAVAIPSVIGYEVHKKDKVLKRDAQMYAARWERSSQ